MKPIIHLIVAARPNFMKIAPLYHVLKREGWCEPVLVHTGQHYDPNMSGSFLEELQLPEPDIYLHIGSGSHAEQTAGVMLAYEKVCRENPPDWIVVVGDVNATMACSITAAKLWLPVGHLEAGLRSGDRRMPEEINRILTDSISDLLWTPSPDADENLLKEGIPADKIVRVGNIMMDSYELMRPRIEASGILDEIGLAPGSYAVLTLHRPSNVDEEVSLKEHVETITAVSQILPVVFPVHPRTEARLREFNLLEKLESNPTVILLEPQAYIPFMSLVSQAKLVITDSGGIQEETTYLNIPCLTLRENTERPITITQGTNRLVRASTLLDEMKDVVDNPPREGTRPELWDGRTAERVAVSLKEALGVK